MEYFVVYAADNASLIVLRDLLVNGDVKETMEAFGLGIDNRDIYGVIDSSFVRWVCDQYDQLKSSIFSSPARLPSFLASHSCA